MWLDSADILDVWTCDDRQPCARSGLWPARARACDVNFSPDCNRPKSPRSERGDWLPRGNRHCQFSGNARPRPQVVIARIAVRHDHHWHPVLLSGDPIVVKEEPDDDHHHNPAVDVEPPADDHGEDEESEDLAGKMSTIWRPDLGRLRASVAEMEGSESGDEEKDATKRGRSGREPLPRRAMRARGEASVECKVCSACPHGRLRLRSSAGVRRVWLNLRARAPCKECGGSQICVHGRERPCKECGGGHSACTAVTLSVQGVRWVSICGTAVALLQGVRRGSICRARPYSLWVQGGKK